MQLLPIVLQNSYPRKFRHIPRNVIGRHFSETEHLR